MPETPTGETGPGNTALPSHGDHDRVVMLSLRADGTPDQHNPEIIGDKQFALDATKQQFAEQAVSAVDTAKRGVTSGAGGEQVAQDPAIAELKEAHESAAKAAEGAAESAVGALFTEEPALQTGTADTAPAKGASPEKPVVDKPAAKGR